MPRFAAAFGATPAAVFADGAAMFWYNLFYGRLESTGRKNFAEESEMADLLREKCVACRRDSPRVTEAEMKELGAAIPKWQVIERDGIPRLERIFTFPDFAGAIAFTNRVAAIAEEEGHHPALLTEWGRVAVTWWTHKIRGLHRNDFIMAAKTDAIARQAGVES